jgi:hypothetical protein
MGSALVDADWSVELGTDDPALEFPWSSPDGSQRFVDLSQHREAIASLPEVAHYSELADVLIALNADSSPWLTAKCDIWTDDDLGEAEEIYDAQLKVCSYIDLVRRTESERLSFEQHEKWVKSAASASQSSGMDDPIACELIVRRCWYRSNSSPDEPEPGFYITVYVSGYGYDEPAARAMWAGGLTRVSGILVGLPA